MTTSIWQRKDSIREGVLGEWFINRDVKNGCDLIDKKVYSKGYKYKAWKLESMDYKEKGK